MKNEKAAVTGIVLIVFMVVSLIVLSFKDIGVRIDLRVQKPKVRYEKQKQVPKDSVLIFPSFGGARGG